MYTNPMWKNPTPKKFPLSICCVMEDTFYTNPRISNIREYAHKMGATFTLREYDTFKFSVDRKYVERLPAFHIYINKCFKNISIFRANSAYFLFFFSKIIVKIPWNY